MDMRGALLTVVTALAIACGANENDGGGAPTIGNLSDGRPVDACALLTAAEIGGMLSVEIGTPRQAPGTSPGGPISTCQWPAAGDDPLTPFVQVSVTPNAASSSDEWMADMAREMGSAFDADEHPRVDGIGDWAVYAAEDRTLIVAAGPRLVHVMVDPSSGGAEAIALARLAIGRLER